MRGWCFSFVNRISEVDVTKGSGRPYWKHCVIQQVVNPSVFEVKTVDGYVEEYDIENMRNISPEKYSEDEWDSGVSDANSDSYSEGEMESCGESDCDDDEDEIADSQAFLDESPSDSTSRTTRGSARRRSLVGYYGPSMKDNPKRLYPDQVQLPPGKSIAILFIGMETSGKSATLNSLLGEPIAPVSFDGSCTRHPTIYTISHERNISQPKAEISYIGKDDKIRKIVKESSESSSSLSQIRKYIKKIHVSVTTNPQYILGGYQLGITDQPLYVNIKMKNPLSHSCSSVGHNNPTLHLVDFPGQPGYGTSRRNRDEVTRFIRTKVSEWVLPPTSRSYVFICTKLVGSYCGRNEIWPSLISWREGKPCFCPRVIVIFTHSGLAICDEGVKDVFKRNFDLPKDHKGLWYAFTREILENYCPTAEFFFLANGIVDEVFKKHKEEENDDEVAYKQAKKEIEIEIRAEDGSATRRMIKNLENLEEIKHSRMNFSRNEKYLKRFKKRIGMSNLRKFITQKVMKKSGREEEMENDLKDRVVFIIERFLKKDYSTKIQFRGREKILIIFKTLRGLWYE